MTTLFDDSNATAWAHSAWSWALRGQRAACQSYVDKLTDEQRDEVMAAALVLFGIAGGLGLTEVAS